MKTFLLFILISAVCLLNACRQQNTAAVEPEMEMAPDESIEDGFTAEQFEEMARWQQEADSVDAADPDNFSGPEDPLELLKEKGLDWIPLLNQDGEWVIYEECLYGSGGLYFDENGKWLEFSGGGDANSHEIEMMERTDGGIRIVFVHSLTGNKMTKDLRFLDNGMMIMKDERGESRYVESSGNYNIKTVQESCDE